MIESNKNQIHNFVETVVLDFNRFILFLQTVFDPMYISVYNLFYTSLPVLALGVFEQDVSDKDSIKYPKLYTPGITNELFNLKEFIRSVMHGLFSSLVTFIIPYGTYRDGISPEGWVLSDHMTLASVIAAILILDNTAQVCTMIFVLDEFHFKKVFFIA